MHIGALRAWDGRPPVGVKIVIEGQEETGSVFTTFPPTQPDLFAADAMVIGDMGSIRPGVPTLTVGLRGMGASPRGADARRARSTGASSAGPPRMRCSRSSTHSRRCTTNAVTSPSPGLLREEWTGASYSDEEFRELAEIEPGLPFSAPAASASASGPGRLSR